MRRQVIKKQDAADVVGTALDHLYEARVLRLAAEFIQENHDENCEQAHEQVDILNNVAEERLDGLFEALDFTDSYFRQKPRNVKRATKKLAVVKKAA
jgi:hypothetical protein